MVIEGSVLGNLEIIETRNEVMRIGGRPRVILSREAHDRLSNEIAIEKGWADKNYDAVPFVVEQFHGMRVVINPFYEGIRAEVVIE